MKKLVLDVRILAELENDEDGNEWLERHIPMKNDEVSGALDWELKDTSLEQEAPLQ